MAPVVDLKDRVFHRHSLDARLDLPGEYHSGRVQILIVDPYRKDEVPEFPLGDIPSHLVPGVKGRTDVGQVIFSRVVREIGQRHVSV